jgi:uncharacterized protein YbjT (DUF2867 family)
MSTNENILVIGGAGKTGRRVAERLTERGVPVRLASRSTEPSFDWEDRDTWAPALEGATAAYITYYPDLAVEGSAERIGALGALAVETGVRRLVLLSGRGEQEAGRAEQAVLAVQPEATIVAVQSGSCRTSTRATSPSRWPQASWRCRPATCASRSSTPRTSPTSPSRP